MADAVSLCAGHPECSGKYNYLLGCTECQRRGDYSQYCEGCIGQHLIDAHDGIKAPQEGGTDG